MNIDNLTCAIISRVCQIISNTNNALRFDPASAYRIVGALSRVLHTTIPHTRVSMPIINHSITYNYKFHKEQLASTLHGVLNLYFTMCYTYNYIVIVYYTNEFTINMRF